MNHYIIDGKQLSKSIRDSGLKLIDISEKVGHTPSYISQCCSRERIPIEIAEKLEEMGIDMMECIKETDYTNYEFHGSYKELYAVVYKAVYEAVKKAWSE